MTKWKYRVVLINNYAEGILNDMGEAGWELICIVNSYGYFKAIKL